MKKIKNLIIGSGFSSFIYSNSSTKRHTVFSEKSNHVRKSGNFYEYNTIGAIQISGEDILILKDITNF